MEQLDLEYTSSLNKMKEKASRILNDEQDISKYEQFYLEMSNDWYNPFIYQRIEDKRTEGFNPNLTDDDIEYLRTNIEFCNYFKHFLEIKLKCDYYNYIENQIINNSRGEPSEEYFLGEPTISFELRNQNASFVKSLGDNADGNYQLIELYLNLIEKNHQPYDFNKFLEDIYN